MNAPPKGRARNIGKQVANREYGQSERVPYRGFFDRYFPEAWEKEPHAGHLKLFVEHRSGVGANPHNRIHQSTVVSARLLRSGRGQVVAGRGGPPRSTPSPAAAGRPATVATLLMAVLLVTP